MEIIIKDYSEQFFNRFEALAEASPDPEDVLDFWADCYAPELDHEILPIIEEAYAEEDMTLEDYPLQQVFPHFVEDLPKMKIAAVNLYELLDGMKERFQSLVDGEGKIYLVIYVGAGTGAGHVTKLYGEPVILFGLENIARLGWYELESLEGLAYHELGHVVHMVKREAVGYEFWHREIWYTLYGEGIAQRFEQHLKGNDSWHMSDGDEWQGWIEKNYARLTKVCLERIEAGHKAASDLFGSNLDDPTCNFEGKTQVGYYIGTQMVKEWEKEHSLQEIMEFPLEVIREKVLQYLESHSH